MKFRWSAILLVVLLLALAAAAQDPMPQAAPKPERHAQMAPGPMGWLQPPPALRGEFWKNPQIASELGLTEAQKKQLEQTSVNTKLSLIDAGANGLKSYVRLQSLLEADQLDEAAYNQQLNLIAAAADKLVKDFGGAALAIRKTLSAEQWRKLNALRAARPGMHREMTPFGPAGPGERRPTKPGTPPPAH